VHARAVSYSAASLLDARKLMFLIACTGHISKDDIDARDIVAGLISAILYIGHVIVLERISCHILPVLPYSAIFCQVLLIGQVEYSRG